MYARIFRQNEDSLGQYLLLAVHAFKLVLQSINVSEERFKSKPSPLQK